MDSTLSSIQYFTIRHACVPNPTSGAWLTFRPNSLAQLQEKLQKICEIGAELRNLNLGKCLSLYYPSHSNIFLATKLASVHPSSAPVRPSPTQSSSLEPIISPPALSQLQTQLHNNQSPFASHVDKVRALEGVFAEHEAIKREVSLLRLLVEGTKGSSKDEEEEEFVSDNNDARSVCTVRVMSHELEHVDGEDEEQAAQQEAYEGHKERSRRRSELGRLRTPEPTNLGMASTEEEDESQDHARPRSTSLKPSLIMDDFTERLTTLSNQLKAALVLSTFLQAQHNTAQNTISALESKVNALESLVQSTQKAATPIVEVLPLPPAPVCDISANLNRD